MTYLNETHGTKNLRMEITNNSTRKQAGSNSLKITVNSNDWRLSDQTVSMTIRDAKALQSFLNQHLEG